MLILLAALLLVVSCDEQGTVLVLGGQGLSGSATLNAILDNKFDVTALNDNRNYYDYHARFEGKMGQLVCNRPAGLDGCFELKNFLQGSPKIRAVVDFTSATGEAMAEAVRIFAPLNPDVYIFVSAAAIYDVSADSESPLSEENGVRPEDPEMRENYAGYNEFGDKMMAAEEVLKNSELNHVILRCGDIVGPRDTTYRWWQYQVWAEHFKVIDQGFPVPNDYKNLPFSMTYGEDVGQAVVQVLNTGITNQVYNIAIDKTFSLSHFLLELCVHFEQGDTCWADFTESAESDVSYHLYPSSHQGVLSLAKAKEELSFIPTPWEEVLLNTVNFYEGARNAFTKERDIMLKRLNKNVVPYLRVEPLNDEVTKTATTTYGAPAAPETKVEL